MAIELPFEELDGYVNQICSGEKLAYIDDSSGKTHVLLFKYPSPQNNLIAEHVFKEALEEATEMGLPTVEEVENLIQERGLFSSEDKAKIEKLKSRKEGQQAVLAKSTRVPANRDRLKNIISNIQDDINKIEMKRQAKLENTRERKAAEAKYLYLTSCGVHNPFSRERHWRDQKEFDEESDYLFRRQVYVDYIIFSYGLKQEIIRYVARSNLWRIKYTTALKIGDTLFDIPIRDYSVDQSMVLYWSHYYQSINEMMPEDRPADEIIEDDQALDAYMKDWQADKQRDFTATKAKSGKGYGDRSAWDHGETLVMKSNPVHEDIEYSKTLAEKAQYSESKTFDAAPANRTKKNKKSKFKDKL